MSVLNFGSLNIDHVYQLHHIVAPGETIAAEQLCFVPGGKGLNQSIALAKSGADTYHAGCVGYDGGTLLEQLASAGVHTQSIRKLDMVNGHAIIQVNEDGQNSIIIFGGANTALTRKIVDEIFAETDKPELVLLQNEISQVTYIAQLCGERKIPLAFNPSPFSEALRAFPFETVRYLLINETEGKQITGKGDPQEIAAALLEQYPDMKVVLTLGGSGVYYRDKETELRQDGFRVKAVDTTGAGDTFTGFFLGNILQGKPVTEALRIACAAGALSVTKPGAAPSIPGQEEVGVFLQEHG